MAKLRMAHASTHGARLGQFKLCTGEIEPNRSRVAHVYFTTRGKYINGRAKLESICDKVEQPIAAIKWKDSTSRTAMTTAHEIGQYGHVLGMWHHLHSPNGARLQNAQMTISLLTTSELLLTPQMVSAWKPKKRSLTQTHLIVEFVTNVASFCAPLAAGVKELDYVVCGKVLV